jgi:hypothetical protein
MSTTPPDRPSLAPPPGGWPDIPVVVTSPRPRRAARKSHRGAWVVAIIVLLFAAGAAVAGVALSGGSKPLTPLQQCVASIRAEPASQVLGDTPACLRLPVAQRNTAIAQAGE